MCRRWRSLVFGSPRRLDLKLYCSPKTPAKDRPDVWPTLPLIIEGDLALSSSNIVAALEQSDRVCRVYLPLTNRELALMRVPFPELTVLQLWSNNETPAIPDSFLGGSAPRLQSLFLHSFPIPGLPKLILPATHLTRLYLYGIPYSGYISPQAIVTSLSVLSRLERFFLEFKSPQSRPDLEAQSVPPPRRSILPALANFHFRGVTGYLEELVNRIDTPELGEMYITFFNQINFDFPRLTQFINCTPTLIRAPDEARVQFNGGLAIVILRPRTHKFSAIF